MPWAPAGQDWKGLVATVELTKPVRLLSADSWLLIELLPSLIKEEAAPVLAIELTRLVMTLVTGPVVVLVVAEATL